MFAAFRTSCAAAAACVVLLVAGCGGDGTNPLEPLKAQPGVRAVLGANVTDTVQAQPLQALVVEVRGPDGKLASGAVVRFESQPPADTMRRSDPAIFVCPLSAPTCGSDWYYGAIFTTDTTDANGRAKVMVRLGFVAGRAVVKLTVPEFGLVDSATYTVLPGAISHVKASAPFASINIGTSATLRGSVVDRFDNPRPEIPSFTSGPGGAVSVNPTSGVVNGVSMGMQWVFTGYGAFKDSTRVTVVPAGRLVVWSNDQKTIRLVNMNGTGVKTLATGVSSDLGTFPRFDETRQRVILHSGTSDFGGPPAKLIVLDTSLASRRDIDAAAGFSMIITQHQLTDGTVLVVGRRTTDASGYSLYRVATNDAVTLVSALPALSGMLYGSADISHDGNRVAYVASNGELRVFTVGVAETVLLEPAAWSPRWSSAGDRVAYLIPRTGSCCGDIDGVATVNSASGSDRHVLGNSLFSPGLAWSPDGSYLIGRANSGGPALRLIRVSDVAEVLVYFPNDFGYFHDYFQPDWK